MNISQWISERLQLIRLNLTPSQINSMAIGIGAVVLLYIFFKLWQWQRRRAAAAALAPRRRPRKSEAAKPLSRPETSAGKTTAAAAPQPAAAFSTQPAQPELVASGSVREYASAANNADRKYASGTYWPVEPKTVIRKNLFEDVGEEYPWAGQEDYAFGTATPIMAELLPVSEDGRRTLTKALRNAGYYQPHAWHNLASVRYLGIILPIILFGALLVVVPETLEPYMIAGLVLGPALGWSLPALYVRSRAAERLREIENAMPDMLDLLNMCVSQGMTVPASLKRVSRDIAPVYPALAKELTIVAEQARVGQLTEALGNFSERVDTPEVHSFASLLIQTEQMGTSVSEALIDYSDSMREGQKQRADEKANAATFKLLFPTVLCLMPAVFLFLMGPALIELNRFFASGGLQGLDRGAAAAIENQRETPQQ